ncbi:hypothetical protein ACU8KH_01704 [Lachancea thermotolerans]
MITFASGNLSAFIRWKEECKGLAVAGVHCMLPLLSAGYNFACLVAVLTKLWRPILDRLNAYAPPTFP